VGGAGETPASTRLDHSSEAIWQLLFHLLLITRFH
jgi:hypothetical protein